jgi:hypothetical protein
MYVPLILFPSYAILTHDDVINISQRRDKVKSQQKEGRMKEWYTSKEAADFLRIPMHRLARLRREDRITGVVGGGENPRYAMYHISELEKVDISDQRKKKDDAAQPRHAES